MNSLRKVSSVAKLAANKANVARSTAFFGRINAQSNAFSTFIEKERGEEARYIRQEEQRRREEIKAKLTAILEQDDSSKEKVELVEMLEGKAEKEKGFLAKYGMDNIYFKASLGAAFAVPLLTKGIIVFNEETYVLIAFGLFFATAYTQGGPMLAKSFEESIANIRKSLTDVDDVLKQKIDDEVKQVEELVGMDKTYTEIHNLVDNLSTVQADTLNAAAEYKYRDLVAKKLDALVALENATVASLRQRALNDVKTDVLNTFKNDKKVKEAALNHALSVLSGGPNTKNGKDIVGDTFVSSFKTYRDNYSKQPAGTDKIIANLEKEIAAILSEPVLEEKGGNVYVSHPVSQRYVA